MRTLFTTLMVLLAMAGAGLAQTFPSIGSMPNPNSTVQVLNVKTYGAKADGVADDTTAIQAALTAVTNSSAQVARVYLPKGRYKITATLMLPANSYHVWAFTNSYEVVGDGKGSTVIDASAVTGNAIQFDAPNVSPGPTLNGCHLRGFTVVGPEYPTFTGTSQGAGIYIGNSGWHSGYVTAAGWMNTVEDVDISGFRDLFCTTNAIQTMLNNCRFWSNYTRAAIFSDRSDTLMINNCAAGYNWVEGTTPSVTQSNELGALVAMESGVGVWVTGGDGWNWSKRAAYINNAPVSFRAMNIEHHWGEEFFLIVGVGFSSFPVTVDACTILGGATAVGNLASSSAYTRSFFHGTNFDMASLVLYDNNINDSGGMRPFRFETGAAVTTFSPPTVLGRKPSGALGGDADATVNGTPFRLPVYSRTQAPVYVTDSQANYQSVSMDPTSKLQLNGGNTTVYTASAATINAAGTGYSVNDKLQISAGSGYMGRSGFITVNTVNGSGVITASTLTDSGLYYFTQPTTTANPVSGGTGSGATFNVTFNSAPVPKQTIMMPVGTDPNFSVGWNGETIPGGNNNVSMTYWDRWASAPVRRIAIRNENDARGILFGINQTQPNTALDVSGTISGDGSLITNSMTVYQAANYTVKTNDVIVQMQGNLTCTLPSPSVSGARGKWFCIETVTAGTNAILPSAAETFTIRGQTGLAKLTNTQVGSLTYLHSNGTNWFAIINN